MIDYEKIAEVAVIMADFASELRELCGRYSKKIENTIKINCATGIDFVSKTFKPEIMISSLSGNFTEQDLVSAGFVFAKQRMFLIFPIKEYIINIQGVTIRAAVWPEEKRNM